jgi:hypothetical protein
MQASEHARAVADVVSTVSSLGLPVGDVVVLQDSNRLALRLLPCDVLAQVAPDDRQVALLALDLAQRLAALDGPVAAPDPRVEPRLYRRDGLAASSCCTASRTRAT